MENEWEEFTQKSVGKADAIRVSLNARGNIALNLKAIEALGSPEAVVLLFDRSNQMIGLKPSSREVSHAYEIKRQGTSQSFFVRARSFCTFYGIDIGDTIAFNDVQDRDGMLVLQLANVTEAVRRPRPVRFPEEVYESAAPVHPAKFSTLLRMKMAGDE